jgi:RNA polymerase sigma factor (sigma-70 family)
MMTKLDSLSPNNEPISDQNPESDLLKKETRELLEQAINSLPERYRQAIIHHIHGQSPKEGAELMGCSENAFKIVVSRGVDKLHEKLKNFGKDMI